MSQNNNSNRNLEYFVSYFYCKSETCDSSWIQGSPRIPVKFDRCGCCSKLRAACEIVCDNRLDCIDIPH